MGFTIDGRQIELVSIIFNPGFPVFGFLTSAVGGKVLRADAIEAGIGGNRAQAKVSVIRGGKGETVTIRAAYR
ncbi:hypothetical protein E05_12050 [Plautia stali symbiont]|nr:hypothetical protein E05_12050 [Plautia stali symbiont]